LEIDILKAKESFNEYVKNYNIEDEKIKIKKDSYLMIKKPWINIIIFMKMQNNI
jgi:hypothetical protein